MLNEKQKRFLTLFIPMFFIPYILIHFLPLAPITQTIAGIEASALTSLGVKANAFENVIATDNITYKIIPDCTGIVMVLLFLALYYSTKEKSKQTLTNEFMVLLPYVTFLLLFNLARLLATILIGVFYGPNASDVAHFALWFVDSGVVIAAWLHARKTSERNPRARRDYLEKLDGIRKGKFVKVKNFSKRYGI